jgi:L-alanine-DL-glutamate epimerase-like enolase superfamily enzyme
MTSVPITAGEEWGQRWDFNTLVENHDLDYIRVTLPNVGGITEMMKVLALCETHAIGIIPHFTGPLSTAALVNVLSTYSQSPCCLNTTTATGRFRICRSAWTSRTASCIRTSVRALGVTADMSQVEDDRRSHHRFAGDPPQSRIQTRTTGRTARRSAHVTGSC